MRIWPGVYLVYNANLEKNLNPTFRRKFNGSVHVFYKHTIVVAFRDKHVMNISNAYKSKTVINHLKPILHYIHKKVFQCLQNVLEIKSYLHDYITDS